MNNVQVPAQVQVGVEPTNYIELSPWAGLASECEHIVAGSVKESLIGEGLDWTVEKQPLFLKDGRKVPDRTAIVKNPGSQILGTAGKLFTPVQNVDAFGTLQPAIDDFGASIQGAGLLGSGQRVWMQMSLPEKKTHEVVKGDVIKPYFLVTNAHTSERSQSLQARYTAIRVWCENSLNAAMKEDRAAVSIPHHKNANERLKEITDVIARMYQAHENSVKVFHEMSKVKIEPTDMVEYLKKVFKLRDEDEDQRLTKALLSSEAREAEGRVSKVFEARDNALWLLDNGKHTGRTAWGAYNAVTEYIDHVSILKKDGGLTKNGFATAAFGYGAYQKQKALDIALERWMKVKKN